MKKMPLAPLLLSGTGYVELKQQENRSQSLAFLNGTLVNNNNSSSGGIMSRTFINGVWGLASSVSMNSPSMEKVIKKALSNAKLLSKSVNKGKLILPSATAKGEYLFFTKKPQATTADKIDFLKALDDYTISKYPDLSTRQIALRLDEMEKFILTSDGGEMHTMTPRSISVIVLMLNHNGEPLTHYDVFGGFGQYEDNFSDPAEYYPIIDKVYKELSDKKEAVFARGGTFECVLDAKLAGILSHEAIGHTTEADFVINGSIAGEYLDKPVANDIVTLIDIAHTWDGKMCPVPVFIDDEGTKAEDCVIIENGILKCYMHNKESALLLGHELTGNARGYAYSDEPLIRMRNTMIVPGKDKLQDMIASIEDGYYLVTSSNGQADATSEFMFGVGLGYEIKNGKIGKAIKETSISGVAFDLLKTVTMISDDMNWTAAGMCGKKQMIPVGMGGPPSNAKLTLEVNDGYGNILTNAMATLLDKGADKVSLWLNVRTKEEFNIVYKELNLLRSVESQSLSLIVIKDQKQATTTLNQFDASSVAKAIDDVMTAVESSNADPAFDISPMQEPQMFTDGPKQMDADKIMFRLKEFTATMKQDFPNVFFDASLSFSKSTRFYLNSNGVDFEETSSAYSFMTMFTAKIGRKMSSFNYTGFEIADLNEALMETNFTRELIRQITEQTETKAVPQNFTGDVIMAPFVSGDLLDILISQQFGSTGLLTNSSRFPDHIGQQILDVKLTVYNKPTDSRLASKGFVTNDVFLAKDASIIENGVLKHYPIGLFTANKVGKPRTIGDADYMVVEAGATPLAQMIKGVKEGVLCMRASFGQPNANGDMSAVLKNSYYIKDGKIAFPISETMMSLNLVDIFNDIKDISAETFNTGSSIFPYIQVGGAAISRK